MLSATTRDVRFAVPDRLVPIMRAILDDDAIQSRLAGIQEIDAFTEAVGQVADELQIELPVDDLKRVLDPDPLGLNRWAAAPMNGRNWPPRGWLPARANRLGEEPTFDWMRFADGSPSDPFFEDSARRAGFMPFNWLMRMRSSLGDLIEASHGEETVAPSGFIFHTSRCGSTLVARMLMALPHHCVMSEPDPLDAVVHWAQSGDVPIERQIAGLRAIVAALGRRRSAQTQRFFIKLDSWHILSLPLFRAAFPDVPWVFLYRDPVEVLVSHAEMPGLMAVPGSIVNRLAEIADGEAMPPLAYLAAVIKSYCSVAVAELERGGGVAVNYRNLPDAALDAIPRHFGFVPTAQEVEAFKTASGANAKLPDREFVADSATKQKTADSEMRRLVSGPLLDAYNRLEAVASRAAHPLAPAPKI